ncbi:hypothetical protein AAY473_032687 [Plecturocebus cupreus]
MQFQQHFLKSGRPDLGGEERKRQNGVWGVKGRQRTAVLRSRFRGTSSVTLAHGCSARSHGEKSSCDSVGQQVLRPRKLEMGWWRRRGGMGCPRAAHPAHGPLEPPSQFPPRTRPANPAQGEGWSPVLWLPHQRVQDGGEASYWATRASLVPDPRAPRLPYLQGPDLLLGKVVGHRALGAQPAQAADGDVDELLELSALLQRPAGRGPGASLRGRRIPTATALLLLSHRRRAQRRSIHASASGPRRPRLGARGRGRLGREPPSREGWTRSDPRRCLSRDAGRASSRIRRSVPPSCGGKAKATATRRLRFPEPFKRRRGPGQGCRACWDL